MLKPMTEFRIPEETIKIDGAPFPNGNIYMKKLEAVVGIVLLKNVMHRLISCL